MEWLFVKDLKRVPGIISATLPLKEGKQMKSKLYLVLVPFLALFWGLFLPVPDPQAREPGMGLRTLTLAGEPL